MKETLNKIKEDYEREIALRKKKTLVLSYSRLVTFVLSLTFFILYFSLSFNLVFLFLGIIFLVSFITLVIIHHFVDKYVILLNEKIKIINRYLDRTTEEWKNEDYKIEGIDKDNLTTDLDIISSSNSLLKFLDFTSSKGGKDQLIKNLKLESIDEEDILLKQKSVEELISNKAFILDFIASLESIDNIHKIDFKEYFSLFNPLKKKYNIIFLVISLILSLSNIVILILWICGVLNYIPFVCLSLATLFYSYLYSRNYIEEFETINKTSRVYKDLKGTYNLTFPSFKERYNLEFKESVLKSKNILKYIVRLGDFNTFKLNIVTNVILNVFASLNFILIYMYQNLLKNKSETFISSILFLEREEYLVSLTTIPLTKENVSLPTINKEGKINLLEGKHPLINESYCVSNSFSSAKDINIITGSNMSGKTSFMKMVALNLVLSLNGTYCNAKEFSFPLCKIFTSINVRDDITNGISTFYGELSRIKDIINYLDENENALVIVFIDEIFKGTNYKDRIYGAKEVVKKLSSLNVITFLTTHDFELCEIDEKKIFNYHFEENYVDEQITFDYKIKEGICNKTNARYLMKKMKIIS